MIVALNNKSNLTKEEFLSYQKDLSDINTKSTLILCPNFLNIACFNLNNCHLGSQNVSKSPSGAHTGEISSLELKSFSVEYCIVGHSERRTDQKETDEDINLKIKNLLKAGIKPILCVGETEEERKSQKTKEIIEKEITAATIGLTDTEKNALIIAYEPIWSIGTGLIPTNAEIEAVFFLIKSLLPKTKTLYGGSANEKNVDALKKCDLLDGYLLGGLSLKPDLLKVFLEKLEN